ncbi:energy transducer TonB [Campylobacter hepaticus]|uniref:Energy transducer TonB n=1 Tax=Campylobacter hepaticus TaxID=1813019 RepID=A0A6A7JS99_9BACT|nr:energy transducer TonB [Campylobacter hepaticus]AXP09313.1 energy transducer TonB [Campylobacter hepaticus]MCZ0772942.1 energy transducer TonB [Campylobacter hepaticus]MCZ0774411.1 energy transducer TonB [Campylobacter hepaticus]MCZ0775663.1 energy transducer TonB [Campylobacter hepaticus]MDX2323551.1 energy transducer TonB [Campylobacter hepaticus]
MKTLFFNHKYQAFYITFFIFMPLVFIFLHLNNFFKTEIKNQNTFSLTMKHFIQINQNQENKITQTTIKQAQKQIIKKTSNPNKAIKKHTNLKKPSLNTMQVNKEDISFLKTKHIQTNQILQDNTSILQEIQQAIQQVQIYPKQAIKMRMQGIVKVEFLWKKNKSLAELKILESSGYDLLDKNALKSILKASVFFPSYEKDLKIVLPIVYHLS